MTKGLVISWVPYHGRSAALASELGYACEFVYTDRKLPSPIRYFFRRFVHGILFEVRIMRRSLLCFHRSPLLFVFFSPANLATLSWRIFIPGSF